MATSAGVGHKVQRLAPGQRVRLRPPLPEVELTTPSGVVMAVDPDNDGYYLIRLDEPALYWPLGLGNPLGEQEGAEPEQIEVLRETPDNLDIREGDRWVEPAWVVRDRARRAPRAANGASRPETAAD